MLNSGNRLKLKPTTIHGSQENCFWSGFRHADECHGIRVRPHKFKLSKLLHNLCIFVENPRIIILFTRASYWMVIQLRWKTPLSETNILILSSHMHLVVPSDLFPTRSRIHFSCAFLSSVYSVSHLSHSIRFDHYRCSNVWRWI